MLQTGTISELQPYLLALRFHGALKALAETEEGQMCLLKALYGVWKTHQQVGRYTYWVGSGGKLLKCGHILKCVFCFILTEAEEKRCGIKFGDIEG